MRDPGPRSGAHAVKPALGVGAALALGLLLVHALSFHFAVDDAWISFRYARNLIAGHGLVFNPGDAVEGYSNLLWVLLSAAGMAAGMEPLLWARIMGFLSAAVMALLLPALARRLASDADLAADRKMRRGAGGATPGGGSAAMWLVAASGPIACWSLGGLETPLFGLLTVLAWRAALERRSVAAGILGVLLTLTRPEGIALGLCFAAWATLAPAAGPRRWLGLAIVAAGAAAHLLWRHATYGEWLPNTFFAKTGDIRGQLRTGIPYAASFLPAFVLPWVLLPELAAPGWGRWLWRSAEWRRSLVAIGAWIAYVLAIGGDELGMFRMFAPILPIVIACGATALMAPASASRGRRVAAIALLALLSLVPSFVGQQRRIVTAHMGLYNLGRWRLAAEGLARSLPAATTIALSPVGYIPYRTGFVSYDILGITDRHIAHRKIAFTQGLAGHEKHDGAYILSRRPDYLLLGNVDVTDEPRQGPIPAFRRELDIFTSPLLRSGYVQVSLLLPCGKYLNMFKRVDERPPGGG